MKRSALLLVVLLAVLLVPPASQSRQDASASVLTGTITRVPGGIAVAVTNAGGDSFNYFLIKMVPSVHHTGASIAPAGGCGAGPDSNTVRCGISFKGFEPGQTYTVTIMTDAPYPQNGGAELLAGTGISGTGPWTPAGQASGPPDALEVPCKCTALTARILPATLTVHDRHPKPTFFPTEYMELSFRLHWSLTCSKGTSGCEANLDLRAPQGRAYHTVFYAKGAKTTQLTVRCDADCGTTEEGAALVRIYGANLEPHDRKALGSMPFVVNRSCPGVAVKLPPLRFSIAFTPGGGIDLKRSKLH